MKKIFALLLAAFMLMSMTACNNKPIDNDTPPNLLPSTPDTMDLSVPKTGTTEVKGVAVCINTGIMSVDGKTIGDSESDVVYAKENTVYITEPGNYIISGTLEDGQLIVNLGEGAATDPNAVVTLYLNGMGIRNDALPGIIFQNVYECHNGENVFNVDTAAAGANIYICDQSINILDSAVYSSVSMNVNGKDGVLVVNSTDKGIVSNMHLTMNGGCLLVNSEDDGISASQQNTSVVTINGGYLRARCAKESVAGSGIDSNGWIVMNGGTILTEAAGNGTDASFRASAGAILNGGYLMATGHVPTDFKEHQQNFALFQFDEQQDAGEYELVNADNIQIVGAKIQNNFNYIMISSILMTEGEYRLRCGDIVYAVMKQDAPQMPGLDLDKPGMTPDLILPPDELTPPIGDVEIPSQPTAPQTPQTDSETPEQPEDIPATTESEESTGDTQEPPDKPHKPQTPKEEFSMIIVIENGGNYYLARPSR